MASDAGCCSVVELRQYTLVPGRRDDLVELFDRELVEPQEALGAHVIGQFRDPARPDMFVWLRGFRSMPQRADALAGFYGGPVWRQHREAANVTMVDSDNVLLLRPMWPGAGLPHPAPPRPAKDAPPPARNRPLSVAVYPLAGPASDDVKQACREAALTHGATVAWYDTEPAENTFPALPVRAGENVIVVVTTASMTELTAAEPAALTAALAEPAQRMELQPTDRSELR